MSERYLFFNSNETDKRYYQAQDFAEYFGSVLSSGLLHTDEVPNLVVSVEAGTMNTVITPGNAIIKGHLYENTTPLKLTHTIPEPTQDRIDRVVLRLDLKNNSRFIKLFVKEGVSAASPTAPSLTRDQFVYELSLAQIRVRKNTVQLLGSDLIDERLDEDLCGLVYSLISIPSDQLQNWITSRIDELRIEADAGLTSYLQAVAIAEDALQTAIDAHLVNAQSLYTNYSDQLQVKLAQFETDFMAWFNSLKDQLDKNVALSLQNQINILNGALDGVSQSVADVQQNVDGVQQNVTSLGDSLTTHQADDVRHINDAERTKWDALITDFSNHESKKATTTELGHIKTKHVDAEGNLVLPDQAYEILANVKLDVATLKLDIVVPEGFKKLKLIGLVKNSGTYGQDINILLNSKTSNYGATQILSSESTTTKSERLTSYSSINMPKASLGEQQSLDEALVSIDLTNVTGKKKSYHYYYSGYDSAPKIVLGSGSVTITERITKISVLLSSAYTLSIGSSFTLLGVR